MTRPGRRIHLSFILAGVVACFYWFVPAPWTTHVVLIAICATLISCGILGAMAAALYDIVHPRRGPGWRSGDDR